MKKTQYIPLIVIWMISFFGCKKTDDEIQPSLSINPSVKSIESNQGSFKVAVTSTVKWTASSNISWLKVDPMSGTGDATVQVDYLANTSSAPRTAVITFNGSNVEDKILSVTQSGILPILIVAPSQISVSATTGNTTINITSNISWTASSDQTWLTIAQAGGIGNATLTICYQANTFQKERTACITFYASGVSNQTICITQAAFIPSLFVSPSIQNVGSAAGSTSFSVAANIAWTAESDTNWCTINTSGTGNGTINANFTENTTIEPRIAKITVTGEGVTSQEVIISQAATWTCGLSTLNIEHKVTGGVSPVYKTVTYGTVTNIPGEVSKCWITSNLGADHQANAVDDATEASAGWYWQFNRKQGFKHDGTTRTPASIWITNISENSDWISANDPCNLELGNSWRLPTYNEWYNVDANGGWTSWNDSWNSGLKLHAGGYLINDGALIKRGSYGLYLSNSQYDAISGWNLSFNNVGCYMSKWDGKATGQSIRCIKD